MREIKLLHAADLHLDSAFESLSPEQAKERRQGQREILFKLAEVALRRGVDAVLLCGDVFNGVENDRATERDFCRAMGALPCPVLIAPGNHDPYTAYSMWETVHLPENIYVFKNEEIEGVELPGVHARFWGAGFQTAFCRPLLKDFQAPEKRQDIPDIMLLHADVGNGESAYNGISREDILRSGMDYIALGHIHAGTPLKMAGEVAYAYPGCTEGRGFDETGEKGALLVTVSDAGVEAEFVPLGGVRYEIVSVDISDGEPVRAILKAVAGLSTKDCCRVILTGECDELPDIAQIRKELENCFGELQILDETVPKRDIWAQTGQDTLCGIFLSSLKDMFDNAKTDKERQVIELAVRFGLDAMGNGGQQP
ncbi:MAG: exonuclease SbcCD subunit D [Oscillospiraceae bacterium]